MYKLLCVAVLMALAVAFESGCATKKYVRNRVAERVAPLENRTGELEETSRRNTQQIGELRSGIDDVRMRADRAQGTANNAASSAEQANTRVTTVERNVEDLRANLDKYTIKTTSMVFFKPGSATLTPEAMAQLDQFASQITDRRGFVLEIVGYGDSARATNYNQSLAQLRAEAVQRYLADKDNVPLMRMFAVGFGAARPSIESVSNTSNSGATSGGNGTSMLPRKVEIRLLTNAAVESSPARPGTTSAVSQNP
ncbi:MAG TPA: OmpA family protein [Blastocatellia bacterium]|nr:OmpA family protein [Blastocatellia bacterium]